MRLVIDLQGAQSSSRYRGIGRYSLALALSMARKAGDHEVWIALNDAFPDTIESIRADFDGLVPQDRIVVWQTASPTSSDSKNNDWRRRTGEILRESFLASLKPDIVHISSLFDGYTDNTITSVGVFSEGQNTAVTLYDLVPLIQQDVHLCNPAYEAFYYQKIASMRRAGLWLGISDTSCREGIELLGLPVDKVVNISAAADTQFRPVSTTEERAAELKNRYGLTRPFIMYTGATDSRKNLKRLFGAFGRLSEHLRHQYQLLVVCPATDFEVTTLRHEAKQKGFRGDELVIARSVPDDDLVMLYNLCTVFCFPSIHEGFGLPALEAMQCGAAVIGSNRSSIPEVIGRADALFDPFSEHDIAARLSQALNDSGYRKSLQEHGLVQASKFSWEESARRAWEAFERHCSDTVASPASQHPIPARRPRLAYVSPLPPAQSGIADYSAELLPELGRHYNIDVVVDQADVDCPEVIANCPVRQLGWFVENAQNYERILYHFGNSPFHKHMFDLLERFPGTVVLHDFFLSSVAAFLEKQPGWEGFWTRMLYFSHGYTAVSERISSDNQAAIIEKYPANLPVLENAKGIIVHSKHSQKLTGRYYNDLIASDWKIIPHARRLPLERRSLDTRKALGFSNHDFVLCSFGIVAPTKLNHRLIKCWMKSNLSHKPNCHLVLVGASGNSDYYNKINKIITSSPIRNQIRLTGFAERETYCQYLQAADAAVQLRTQSRGETSGTVLDCMAHAIPTIINRHGSLAELPQDRVIMLPEEFSDDELIKAIEELEADSERRSALGEQARSFVQQHLSPRLIADQYHEAIEHFHTNGLEAIKQQAIAAIATIEQPHADEQDWIAVVRAMNHNLPIRAGLRQLLFDVSGLVHADLKTGIERVSRSILQALMQSPPVGFRIEPIYSVPGQTGYRYARKFTLQFLSCPTDFLEDDPVDVQHGDVFVCTDLMHDLVFANQEFYASLVRKGVSVNFTVYDLLPISLPHVFPEDTDDIHTQWLSIVSRFADNLICISRSVADEVAQWLDTNSIKRKRHLEIQWFHLGSDIERSVLTNGMPDEAKNTFRALSHRPNFLMVGTIEPRKGHALALAAFEQLWREGHDVNLVIVGSEGWKHLPANKRRNIPELVDKLRSHPESGKHLFWLEGISDEYLEAVYAQSSCLIAASEGEGFGLPLIEAARHSIPILARDIPVFREVAGDHAYYFGDAQPEGLARSIIDWLALYKQGTHPKPEGMRWRTWAESAEQFKKAMFAETAYKTRHPGKQESLLH